MVQWHLQLAKYNFQATYKNHLHNAPIGYLSRLQMLVKTTVKTRDEMPSFFFSKRFLELTKTGQIASITSLPKLCYNHTRNYTQLHQDDDSTCDSRHLDSIAPDRLFWSFLVFTPVNLTSDLNRNKEMATALFSDLYFVNIAHHLNEKVAPLLDDNEKRII